MSARWEFAPMDEEYLSRLEAGCQPEGGDLVCNVFRFTEGADEGEIGLWQVKVRGDDALELIRLAREALSTRVQTAQTGQ